MDIVLQDNSRSPFDSIRRMDEKGNEYWSARELMPMLGYAKWERFENAIDRAKTTCVNCGELLENHFPTSGNLVKRKQGGGSSQQDYNLSRYACYLVAMNGDPRKPEIAAAQTYFAVKTREAEVAAPQTYLEALKALVAKEEQRILLEEENRLLQEANEHLSEAVDELFDYSSIIRVAKFNNVSEKTFSWRKLKAASNVMNLEIKKVPCPRFEYKLLYSHDAWRYCYPEMRLPETTTLTIHSASHL